jgi:hypothetical protein
VRKLVLVLVLVLAVVAALPARAHANHTLAHKVQILAGKVAALQGRMACFRRNGAATYLGYPYYEGIVMPAPADPPWPIHTPSTGILDTDFAANFTQVAGGPPDYWLIAIRNTATCRNRFRIIANPYAARLVARAAAAHPKMRLLEAIR